jgi:predicted ATP-dependent protease
MYYHREAGYKIKKESVLIAVLLAFFLTSAFQYVENRSLGVEVEKVRAEVAIQEKIAADLNFRLAEAERGLAEKNALLTDAERELIALQTGRKNRINLLAVVNGEGVTISVESEIKPGDGRLLLDVGGTLYLAETQLSISSAAKAAEAVTGANLADKDVIIRVENPYAQTLGLSGESAGASFAVAIIANLEGRSIRDDVLLTGAINPDGSIGVVGDVPVKALAAKSAKATMLLVPPGQGVEVEGLLVVDVSDIEQALKLMLE